MMQLSGILSRRKIKHRPSWHLVFEWENEISHTLSLPILSPNRGGWWSRSLARRMGLKCPVKSQENPLLEFVMIATSANRGRYGHRSVSWIIDWFLPVEEIPRFLESTKDSPKVLISSLEAYQKLMDYGADKEKYLHVPLSLPDRYRLDPAAMPVKDIDFAIVGRESEVLLGFAKRYMDTHPGLKVVTKGAQRDGHTWVYDLSGNPVADIHSREDYLNLMRRCKLFLYSTPGLDDGKPTNGYSQVTPRFLESLASGCMPIMRYADNADTRFYRLCDFGPSVDDYSQFEAEADRLLNQPVDYHKLTEYLSDHYTSSVIEKYFV